MVGYCITCDRKLEGRQRFYCCDAHRKQYKRLSEKYPFLSDKRPLSVAFDRNASDFGRVPSAITTILVVK